MPRCECLPNGSCSKKCSNNSVKFTQGDLFCAILYFFEDFNSFLSFSATTPHEFIINGDFNIHLDNPTDHFTSQFHLFSFLSTSVNMWIFLPQQKPHSWHGHKLFWFFSCSITVFHSLLSIWSLPYFLPKCLLTFRLQPSTPFVSSTL